MKSIDLRAEWVRQLRDRGLVKLVKIEGQGSPAGLFTKLVDREAYARLSIQVSTVMP